MLATFMVQHPRVNIHLEATNRRVDLISEGVDLAIRVRPPPFEDSDLVMRILGNRRQCLVASPRLLQQISTPKVPADLAHLPSLGLGRPHHEFQWNLLGLDGAQTTVKHWPRFITRDMTALRTAAMAGVGAVQLPNMMIRAELARGELLPLMPDWAPCPETIHAVFVSRRGLLPSVRVLIDFLATQFEALDED